MPLKNIPFRLRLATLENGIRYVGLSFAVSTPGCGFANPVVTEACGEAMDYGKLFAYLFRRFGYPNFGWDGYKELAKYILTTPRKEMFLCIVPYVGDRTDLHFRFIAPMDVLRTADNYGRRFRMEWERRAFEWRERQGIPGWMPEWITFCNTVIRDEFQIVEEYVHWRDTVQWMKLNMSLEPGDLGEKAANFVQAIYVDYRAVEPEPSYIPRSVHWRQWDDEDPLKPYAEAAVIALQDLRRPVRMSDAAVNAFGEFGGLPGMVKEAPVSGYPSGHLGNLAAEEFAELHGLVMKLGKGNARRGIAKLMSLSKQS